MKNSTSSNYLFNAFLIVFCCLSISTKLYAQAPDGVNYQAVIRNFSGTLVANTTIAIRIQIKQTSASGTIVFQERHSVMTSAQGVVNMVIGQGTLLGGNFSTINWATGPYFVSLGVNFTNGTNYLDYGSQQLMSVPYALYAKNAGNQLNQWRYGNTLPAAALGTLGDFYLNMTDGNVYYKSNPTTWLLTGNITGPAGVTGAQGIQGITGAVGAQGIQGLQGLTGPTGPIGLSGPAGAQGIQGLPGTNGTNGAVGATGPVGPTGLTGLTGANGMQGVPGPTGPSGAQGIQGLPGINGTNGAVGATGPTGLTGPAGASGAQGIQGLTGAQGIQGLPGTNGAVGATGPIGPAGAQGIQGLPGTNGAIGATGPVGATGPAGANGTNGTNGQSAYQAAVSNGFVGTEAQWLTSLQGAQGNQGLTGATGAQGIQGLLGATGPIGLTGPAGAIGAQGPIGLTGPAGTNGAIGAQGPSGPAGAQGLTGANGSNGAVGATGATGATGAVGPAGAQGIQGATGLLPNGTVAGNTPYWDGSQWVVNNSNIFNNGGNVGVGLSSPIEKLHVQGDLLVTDTIRNTMNSDLILSAPGAGNINVTNERISKVADASDTLDAVNARVIQFNKLNFGITTGSANAYTLNLNPTPSQYMAGMEIAFKANFANSGGATLNVNALGAKNIFKSVSTALSANDILNGQIVKVIYDGTNFQIMNPINGNGGNAGGGTSPNLDKTLIYLIRGF